MKYFSIFLLHVSVMLIFFCQNLKAETFIVVSNADNGSGTLREALDKAYANGIAERDYIHFNLPGTSQANLTIILNTDLPLISSNVTIDGSTQPSAALGPNGAKVILHRVNDPFDVEFYGLRADGAHNVEIYGLFLKKIATTGWGWGIGIADASGVIIGAPGKGNVITGFTVGIGTKFTSNLNNVTIKNNIIGLAPDGATYIPEQYVQEAIHFPAVINVLIGGNASGEENIIHGSWQCINIRNGAGYIHIVHNKIGTDISGTQAYAYSVAAKVNIIYPQTSTPEEVIITDNLITGNGRDAILLANVKKGFLIQRNKIGTDITGKNLLGTRLVGISFSNCGPGLVGGSLANENIIAGCTSFGVISSRSFATTVSQNRMFCNGSNIGVSWEFAPAERPYPFIHTTACDGTSMSGKTLPNAKIEVFTPYRCADGIQCDGKDYIETFYADDDGNWSYQLNGTDGAVFTATDKFGATSNYSTPYFSLNGWVTPTACGKNLGKIPVILLSNATPFYWEDESGNIVGRDTVLANLPVGKYRLVMYGAGCNKPECIRYSNYFEIRDETPTINTTGVLIKHASCGNKNGSVRGLSTFGNLKYSWRNAANVEVSTYSELYNAAPGEYTLIATDLTYGCIISAGPFKIENIDGPTLDLSKTTIQDAACGKATGNITGVSLSGTGNLSYTWKSEGGTVVGNQAEVTNLAPGKYTLYYKDETNCPEAQSDPFEIKSYGIITIDKSNATIISSACNKSTGSITGLILNEAAEHVRWTNASDVITSNTLQLENAAAGTYTITVSNDIGCSVTETFRLPQVTPAPFQITQNVRHPSCHLSNGSIITTAVSGNTAAAYRWENTSGQVVGREKDIQELAEDTYTFFITDNNNCEQQVASATLKNTPPPAIATGNVVITNDDCNLGTGSIKGIAVNGAGPFTFQWEQAGSVVSHTLQANDLHAGNYTLQVKDANGCTTTSTEFTVNRINSYLSAPAVSNVQIVKGMTAILKAQQAQAMFFHLYLPDTVIPSFSNTTGNFSIPGLTESTTYLAAVQKGDCHSDKTPVTVEVVDAVKVLAPNAFSPNGDGVNDYFRLKAFGLASLEFFSVHNRWGNQVFFTKDPSAYWDGTFNYIKVPAGTYVWTLRGQDITGAMVQQQGTVVVIY